MTNCKQCGNLLIGAITKKFCNRKCGAVYREKKLGHCLLCGTEFASRRGQGKFCSSTCASKATNWKRWGKLTDATIGLVCPGCGDRLAHRTNRKSIFCSHSCAARVNYKPRSKSSAVCHPDRPLVSKGLCQKCWASEHYRANKAKMADYSRAVRLKNNFGITPTQWDMLFELQQGLCPICKKSLYRPRNVEGKRAAAVDHDHQTKRVRGLTCDHCNRFRIARNTTETAVRLVAYLNSTVDGRLL